MKITCRYSGHVITQDNALLFPDFAEINLAAEHPIFSASNKVLLSQKMLSPWYQGTMSEEAKKLLFLAVALNNSLIEFEPCVVAAPTVKTVESCFFPMLRIVSWLQDMNSAKVTPSIPRYKISRETASMDNFRAYLQNVESARRERLDNENKEEFEHKWEASINKIVSNINAGMVSAERSLNIALAKWAMSVTPVPNKNKELWSKLLVMTDKQLISQPSDEISALHDFMEWELPHGSIAAARVMKRCREMLEVSTNLLGHLDNSFFIIPSEELQAEPSNADGKVQIGSQKYSPKVQEAMRKHAERLAAMRASANKPVTSSVVVPHNRRAEDKVMILDDDSTEGEVSI